MLVRSLESCDPFVAGDLTTLRELLHGPKQNLGFHYSLAHARLAPGHTSSLHRLATSEVYYILAGRGRMEIDGEHRDVRPGDAVYIPPGSSQRITALGAVELEFLCIVDPAWRPDDEEILQPGSEVSSRGN